jgi:hypothetical protein
MSQDNDKRNISKHILPTSSNLLGLCFLILTLKKIWKIPSVGKYIDKLDVITILVFLVASLLSYVSMRSINRSERFEKIADILFLVGLTLLSFVAVAMAFELE